jgi:hypothetical protein
VLSTKQHVLFGPWLEILSVKHCWLEAMTTEGHDWTHLHVCIRAHEV